MRLTCTKIILLLLFCLCLFSCKKKVDEYYRPEFVGFWDAPLGGGAYYVHLNISKDGIADYMLNSDGDIYRKNGIVRANNQHIKIGRMIYFKIIDYPHKIDTTIDHHLAACADGLIKTANWKMTLDGPKPALFFDDGQRDYYKVDY